MFHYSLGAVESARKHKCSPRQAFDTKAFSAGHWEWCHRFLIDENKQDGYPTLFLTFLPCEWDFPKVCSVFVHTYFIWNCYDHVLLIPYNIVVIILSNELFVQFYNF